MKFFHSFEPRDKELNQGQAFPRRSVELAGPGTELPGFAGQGLQRWLSLVPPQGGCPRPQRPAPGLPGSSGEAAVLLGSSAVIPPCGGQAAIRGSVWTPPHMSKERPPWVAGWDICVAVCTRWQSPQERKPTS